MPTSFLGYLHLVAASLSMVVGPVQLLRTKGDRIHRWSGYVYAAAMAVNGLSALTIYRFTGSFNVFHALALYSLLSVGLALRPMLVSPRPFEWRRMHYMWTTWSYAGLMSAGTTEFLVRVVHLDGWLGAAVGSPPAIILGAILIPRFAPPRRVAPEPGQVSGS